ncbi:hypothetical protein TNCV_4411531 [Trichonephila clavipes]|nr:hypothetical protein TNCV_4411531 [Trichonephila clavipes]
MIVCPKKFLPHTVTPCEIAVCRSTINAGSDRWPVRIQTRVRWSSALRLNRDSSLKMTRLQSVTLQNLPEVGKTPVDTAYDVGQCGHSSDCTILAIIVFLGRPDPPRRYTLPSGGSTVANTEQLPYRSDRSGGRYVYSTNLLSEAYYTAPIKVRQLLVLPPVTS